MHYFALKTHTDQSLLFDGHFETLTQCLENAVTKQINLSNIDLSHQNLANANLDNAYMPKAKFYCTNLTGTNLSESTLSGSSFQSTELYNTCLSYSDLSCSDFRNASFGATLIDGCCINGSKFSTSSCFDLNFHSTQNMSDCIFEDQEGGENKMSYQPMVFKGILNKPIAILDHTIAIGTKTIPINLLPDLIKSILPFNDQVITIKG